MSTVYNLTDKKPPWVPEKDKRRTKAVKVHGVVIPAGEGREIDNITIASVVGLINNHLISVDNRPGWYVSQKKAVPVVAKAKKASKKG
ncbi:MAG: hypothetical protein ACXAEU_17075 [Candidatus Hodarchaeales archaeon]|jgi:hypothetical protein